MRNTLYLADPSTPTPAEELLYKFIIVGADTITYMSQHPRGRAYVDDLQAIFDCACMHLIARQKQGVDFTHLNPASLQTQNTEGRIPPPPCASGKHVLGTCGCEGVKGASVQ